MKTDQSSEKSEAPLQAALGRLAGGDASVRGELLNLARAPLGALTIRLAKSHAQKLTPAKALEIVDQVSPRLFERLFDEAPDREPEFLRMAEEEIRDELEKRFGASDANGQAKVGEPEIEADEADEAGEDRTALETLLHETPEIDSDVKQRLEAIEAAEAKSGKKRKRQKRRKRRMPPLEVSAIVGELKFVNAGGLGEVYVGQDDHLRRSVAVKFMHPELCESDERCTQFALEAEVTGRLEHPGVVPLYGSGKTDDGRPFYAMRYIDGETLDDAIKRHYRHRDGTTSTEDPMTDSELSLEFRRLLTCFVSLCKTIAYAHNRGIVHRDIKPANVMIGRFGETIVVDWGLATPVMRDERFRQSGEKTLAIQLSGSNTASSTGRGAGTPAFMSPEQFSNLAPTPASDIYSLGATLFVLLCGKPPIKHTSISEIRTDTIEGRLPVLAEIRKGIPKSLQAITYQAMAKSATERYPTALDLAQDVERYLADEPVLAAVDSLGLRLARTMRKHRSAAQVGLLGLVACCLIATTMAIAIWSANSSADLARQRNQTTSARFIARSVGNEIDRVWRVLESEAKSPELIRLIAQANDQISAGTVPIDETSQALMQEFLATRMQANRNVPQIGSIFVLSRDGTQIGRASLDDTTPQLGANFSYRDYFTGIGRDIDPDSRLRDLISEPYVGTATLDGPVHLSGVYPSTQPGNPLNITLTSAVWSTPSDGSQPTLIGLLGTSIQVGKMMMEMLDDSRSWVACLRDDGLSDKHERGLLLGYPQDELTVGPSDAPPRLKASFIDDLDKGILKFGEVQTHPDFANSQRIVIRPIQIQGRGEPAAELDWIVITAEQD